MHGDCVDVEHATERRGDLVVSMLSILKQARDHQLGPSLRAVVHPTQDNVCKYLGYQSVYSLARLSSRRNRLVRLKQLFFVLSGTANSCDKIKLFYMFVASRFAV